MMGAMRDMEIVWDDLLDAFENSDAEKIFFLDRETGEIFAVPVYYDDHDFWEEVMVHDDRYLKIPSCDYDQERLLLHDFIRNLETAELKTILERIFSGRSLYGKLYDILSFYPEEKEQLLQLKEEQTSGRIRRWLEEHDIYPTTSGSD